MDMQLDPESWQRWKQLFDEAAELDPTAQAAALNRHCAEHPELREQFASMLTALRQPAALLDRSLPERFVDFADADAVEPPAPPPLPAGVLLKNRYRIQELIGRGGWSVVYRAADEDMNGRSVVVKLLLHKGAQRSAIDDEIAALSTLHDPGIAAPLDTGVAPDGRRFLVLAYVPGTTLRVALSQGGAFAPGRVVKLLRALGSALEAAHAEGVCHLDLKPENIMLQPHGVREEPVIVDFGISQLLHSPGSASASPAGSLAYIAPEQLNGEVGAASDQYSLALIAAELLSGRKPPPLGSAAAMLLACADLPPQARIALNRALSASPTDRYPDIGAFVAECTAAIDPERRRLLRLAILAASAFVFLLAAGAGTYWLHQHNERQMIDHDMQLVRSQMETWAGLANASYVPLNALEAEFAAPLDRLRRMLAEGHREPEFLTTLSTALTFYGTYLAHPGRRHLGQSEKAITALRQSLDVADILGGVSSDPREWRLFTAGKHDALASILIEAGEYDQARQSAQAGLALLEKFSRDRPDYHDAAPNRGSLLMTLSLIYYHRREFEECLRLRDQGVAIRRELLLRDNQNISLQYNLAGYLATRGYLLRDMGRLDDSFRDYSESQNLVKPLLQAQSWNLEFRWLHARNAMETGKLFLARKQLKIAHAHLEQAAGLMRGMLDNSRFEISSLRSYALCLSWLAVAKFRQGGAPAAVGPLIREAIETNRTALDQDPVNAKARDERDLIRQHAAETGVPVPAP